jgi:Zn finger protein HypA/HybF involved in hydrogenase expression
MGASAKYEVRQCLRCEGDFKPQGKFNRICPQCKKDHEWSEDAETYEIGNISGNYLRAG